MCHVPLLVRAEVDSRRLISLPHLAGPVVARRVVLHPHRSDEYRLILRRNVRPADETF
jgi:hypothetical protein